MSEAEGWVDVGYTDTSPTENPGDPNLYEGDPHRALEVGLHPDWDPTPSGQPARGLLQPIPRPDEIENTASALNDFVRQARRLLDELKALALNLEDIEHRVKQQQRIDTMLASVNYKLEPSQRSVLTRAIDKRCRDNRKQRR